MFFQFSPIRKEVKTKHVDPVVNDSEKIESLVLAPFTPIPKLSFENIKIGDSAIRQLLIKNPTNHDITLQLTKTLPDELNVSYNWVEKCIAKGSEVTFEIRWCPSKKEASRQTITFKDSGKIQKDVHIAFTSVLPNKTKDGKKQKSPTKKYYSVKPTRTSPTKYPPSSKKSSASPINKHVVSTKISPRKYSPKKKLSSPKQTFSWNCQSPSPLKKYSTNVKQSPSNGNTSSHNMYTRDKENIPSFSMNISRASEIFVSPKNVSFGMEQFQPTERRETFVLNENKRETFVFRDEKKPSDIDFDDSLENISPTNTPLVQTNFGLYHQRLPLVSFNGDNIASLVHQQNSSKTISTDSFENKLNALMLSTPSKDFTSTTISTTMYITPVREISPQNRTYELSVSNKLDASAETYIKSNTSGDTYVKGNTSFETYIRGNLSGGTYTKDSSIADLESLNISPCTSKVPSRTRQKVSPKYQQNNSPQNTQCLINTENIRKTIESNVWSGIERSELSRIEEESYIQPSLRSNRYSNIDFNSVNPRKSFSPGGPKNWSKKGGAAFRLAKKTSGLNLNKFRNTIEEENVEKLAEISKKDTNIIIVQNPFLLAATNLVDPFMTSNLYVNGDWIDQQEKDFKKWLNALLTPPEELSSEEKLIDPSKVWQECKKREIEVAPSKETMSIKYHTNTKLNNLRKAAQVLFRSEGMGTVLSKVFQAIDSGKLSIRKDKDVHLNLSLKSELMATLLSYNCLWLRIGLETIYNEVIPLNSNSDVMGLSTFIANRMLKDPYLIKKYKSIHSTKYIEEFNKFFLKKFLTLVYFLDKAKCQKLIPHDPCLFCKKGDIKESKEILLRLARETLSAVGDITKTLKFSGYIVSHSQTYIHEFDYAVNNLGVDLRDGVRLTRVMEIILMRNDLSENLRVPAISRLQKVHNMKVVFDSLAKADYNILYDISPKDIVDGHREKTLSFLWQIIYKFEAPLMVKSATTIQKWFRSMPVIVKRKRLAKIRIARENAATKIQNWYKRHKLSERILRLALMLKSYNEVRKRVKAAIKIQSYFRMFCCRKVYIKQVQTITRIQSLGKGWLVRNVYRERIQSAVIIQSYMRMYMARKQYCKLQQATLLIQNHYRAQRHMKADKSAYNKLKSAAIFVQRKFRANQLAKTQRQYYQRLKYSAITVQRRFRANRLCRKQHNHFTKLKSAAILVQTRYRAVKTTSLVRARFLALKQSVLVLEERYLALKIMKIERQRYLKTLDACVMIQQQFRTWKLMVQERHKFLELKRCATVIQQAYRARIAMHREMSCYEVLRSATVFVQRKFRANRLMKLEKNRFMKTKNAVTKIQIWLRACLEMRKCQTYYLSLKYAVHIIEDRYQAKKQMKEDLSNYQRIRSAVVQIQTRYRAQIAMQFERKTYCNLRTATLVIQRKYRANQLGRSQRKQYLQLRDAAIILQRRFRAQRLMRQCRHDFLKLKISSVVIQRRFRANVMMRREKISYETLRVSVIFIQRKFKANRQMVRERENYRRLREATLTVQQRWKANKLMKITRVQYLTLRNAACVIQQRWRTKKLAEKERSTYKALLEAVVNVQRRWRAKKLCKQIRDSFVNLRKATVTLQQHWRAKKSCEQQKQIYLNKKKAALLIQNKWRATRQAQIERQQFQILKRTTIMVQRRWRANKLGKTSSENFRNLRNAALVVQKIWRANKIGIEQRNYYLQLKKFTMIVQIRWRANILAKEQKSNYALLKKTTIFVQQKWLANKLAKEAKVNYEIMRSTIIFVQNKWRAKKIGSKQKKEFEELKNATVIIQRRWIALRLCKATRRSYKELREATLVIQQRWRAKKAMDRQVKSYNELKCAAALVQRRFRANIKMRTQVSKYKKLRNAAIVIQRYYRGYLLMIKLREDFRLVRRVVLVLQAYARGYLVRRKYADLFTPEAREQRRILKIQTVAAIKIQSTWRGYRCRSSENSEFDQIRRRFKIANAEAVPEKTLEWKCKMAIQACVNQSSTMFQIIKALEDIDFATRRCEPICQELGPLLPKQLYILVSATSRSLPEMTACIYAVNILINFCKYPPTKQYSFVPEYIDNLIAVMLHWCDKESQLFPTICTLLWLFAHNPSWKQIILKLPNTEQRMKKINCLVTRKDCMVKRTVTKGVSYFASYKKLPMPSLLPDWGLDYKNKPNVFTNSLHALSSLLAILNM